MLLDYKVDAKTIAKLVGHAKVQTTLDTYITVFDEVKKDSVEILDDIYEIL